MVIAALCLSLALAQGQPRDVGPLTRDTAVVRGRVTGAATGVPLQGALVTLLPAADTGAASPGRDSAMTSNLTTGRRSRTIATDAAGQFEFGAVPEGRYRLIATAGSTSGRYLPSGYGAGRPNDAGRVIVVARGQEVKDADISLITASAIEGRVVDDTGEPVARIIVNAARVMLGSSVPQRVSTVPAHTDDLGRFRIFGLEPGTYLVLAEGMHPQGSAIEGEMLGFIATFHPASTSVIGAQRVRVLPSHDVSGIDIQLVRSRRYSVTGTILSSLGLPFSPAGATLMRPTLGGFSSSSLTVDAQGRFTARNLDPGDYVLQVRASPHFSSVAATEFAEVPLTVHSDIPDIVVVTQPGISVRGRVVFADGIAPDRTSLTVNLLGVQTRAESARVDVSTAVDQEWRFTLRDVFGPKLLRFASLPAGWALKAVMLGATDITDVATVFRAEHDGQLQMVLTTRAATLEGAVTDESGDSATDATVYVFPEGTASWRGSSPHVHVTDVVDAGRFALRNLAGGRYFAVAVAREGFRSTANAGEEFFAVLREAATAFVIGDDEKRTMDLRVWRWPE